MHTIGKTTTAVLAAVFAIAMQIYRAKDAGPT